jgi:hypothetical protein
VNVEIMAFKEAYIKMKFADLIYALREAMNPFIKAVNKNAL